MEYDHKMLGQQIAKYRKINNMSQKELAQKCDLSQSYITKLEHGGGISINIMHLSNIADILNIDIDDLLSGNLIKFENMEAEKDNFYISEILDKLSTFTDNELILYNRIVNNFLDYKGIKRVADIEAEE